MTARQNPPEGTITLVFTDVERSTEMSKALRPTDYQRVLAEHDKRLRDALGAHHGYEVDTAGDGFFITFDHSRDALACAVAMQESLKHDPIKEWTVAIRIGIYRVKREVFVNARGSYRDREVNLAARLAACGVGGQILVSATAYEEAGNRDEYQWEHWPNRRIRNFDAPETVHELLWDGKSRGEPGARWLPKGFRVERNRYISRSSLEQEILAHFAHQLNDGELARLVTLHGYGGMGKTRLAVACALQAAGMFKDGLYFVPLDDIPQAAQAVIEAIGKALEPEGTLSRREELLSRLRPKFMLLVLDNYEAVDCPEVRDLLRDLLLGVDELRLLITGREAVKLDDAEQLVHVAGLKDQEAEDLFIVRTELKKGRGWRPTDAERPHLRRLLELTECLPLAIELAAAQMNNLSLMEIAESLAATPLIGHQEGHAHVDPSERHESLTRSLDWSYGLLKPPYQEGFARLGLFSAGFTVQTVEAACGLSQARKILTRLHEAALINRTEVDGRSRYTLLRPTRAYAQERLAGLSNADELRERFIDFYVKLAIDSDDINDSAKRAVLDLEWRNAIASAALAAERTSWAEVNTLSESLCDFLLLRSMWSERERLNKSALDTARAAGKRETEGRALNNLGIVYQEQSQWQKAEECHRQSLAIFQEFGDRRGEGQTLGNLGIVYRVQSQWQKAEECYRQSLVIKREFGDRRGEGLTLGNLGIVYQEQSQWQKAEECYRQSLAIFQEFGDRRGEGLTLANMAVLRASQNDIAGALGLARQAVQILETTQDRLSTEQVRGWIVKWEK